MHERRERKAKIALRVCGSLQSVCLVDLRHEFVGKVVVRQDFVFRGGSRFQLLFDEQLLELGFEVLEHFQRD